MIVKLAEGDRDLERISGVMLELRPTYSAESLVAQIKQQRQDGYHVAYVELGGEVICVAGFVVGTKLAWGKHI